MTIPKKTRLDNAAIIYPSCRTRKYSTIYRLEVTLDEDIRTDILDLALQNAMIRFPGFKYTLTKDFFWWYLRRLDHDPKSVPAGPMRPFSFRKNGGFLFKVGVSGCRIVLDMFHALTDGTGAMTFLMSLTAEYIRLRYDVTVPAGKWVLDTEDEPMEEELEDSFDHFTGTKGSLDKESRAWHIHGRDELPGVLNDIRVAMPLDAVKEKSASLGCTVTELLSAVMLKSLQEVRSSQKRLGASPFIKMEIPVNLRPLFGSRTLRNFSSYVHLGIDVRNGEIPFGSILEEVKLQKRLYVHPHRLTTRVAANVELENNLAIRSIPLFIKKPVINFINCHKGDNYCTSTFSNLGMIELPEAMRGHVRDLDFILGRTRRKSGSCAGVSFGNNLNLNFSRKIAGHEFEDRFVRNMQELGIETSVRAYAPSDPSCF